MKVVAPADVHLVAVGGPVSKGDVIDVPDDVGLSLVEQGWKPAKEPDKQAKPDKPAKPVEPKEV